MGFEPQDQEIIRLLSQLKNTEAPYPEHMMVAQRQMYLRRMTEISLGIATDAGLGNAVKPADTPPVSPVAGTLLETALLVAILVEASAVAYFYRDELSDFFQSMTSEPRVQAVEPLPIVATAVEIQHVTPSPAVSATLPSVTLSTSPTAMIATLPSTPVPGLAGDDNNTSGNAGNETTGTPGSPGTTQGESTPVPNADSGNDHDDQGNHYGQTPRPERTKENGNNNNTAPGDNESQPAPEQNTDPVPPGRARPTRENRAP